MRIVLFANTDWYLYNFRLALGSGLRSRGHDVIFVSPDGEYVGKIREAGFSWLEFPFARAGLNPAHELATIFRLRALYRKVSPDIVHHFTIKCVLYGSVAAKLAHVHTICNSITGIGHVFTTDSLKNRFLRPFLSSFYRAALVGTRVIFQNPDDQKMFETADLVSAGCSALIRGSGVDLQRFRPTDRERTAGPVRVTMVARLLKEKGVREFVGAAKRLSYMSPRLLFSLAGDIDAGNPSTISGPELESWTLIPTLEMLGHVENVEGLWAASDIAVLPSYREGTPRSLLEAAASGMPIVATDVPGCREVVRHGENGLLVPPRDEAALASAIECLARNSELRKKYGIVSRSIAEAEFGERAVIEQTIAAYTASAV